MVVHIWDHSEQFIIRNVFCRIISISSYRRLPALPAKQSSKTVPFALRLPFRFRLLLFLLHSPILHPQATKERHPARRNRKHIGPRKRHAVRRPHGLQQRGWDVRDTGGEIRRSGRDDAGRVELRQLLQLL